MTTDPATPLRIHITGNAGSGKTTLAIALGQLIGLHVHHLDSIVWQPGWKKAPIAFRSRPELRAHCPEILIVPQLLRIITRFNSTNRADLVREASTSTKYRWLPATITAFEASQQLL
jgi:adenylate kinase family enzyme